ncbi:hypothetical protein BJX64DRAFT_297459 [Aspergillus heterothallicus]
MPLRIIIVGGVAGGVSAATRARRLAEDASITVLEKGSFVSYANCGFPYALGGGIQSDKSLALQTEAGLEARFNIVIRLQSELVEINPQRHEINVHGLQSSEFDRLSYDKLILAQRAESVRPALREFILQRSCKRAAIIGGGFIGLGAAENLHKLGLDVSMIERSSHVFPPFDADLAMIIHKELERQNVHLYTNEQATNIQDNQSSVRILLSGGRLISADVVVVGVGVTSGVSVNLPAPLALGGPAHRQGRIAADHIFGGSTPYRGNVGTFICQIFDLSAAITGLSVRGLTNLGFRPLWVTVHSPDHAGYYPSSSPMTLRVVFKPGSGRLLDAQAVGAKGVDKQIDVLSMALQAGMSVFDLEHAELGYAPPYGSAKDPVNMAGFVGSNLLRGLVEVVHPEKVSSLLPNWQVIDVRSPEEFARGHLPSARNIPFDKLRENIYSLQKESPVLVYCWVGYRGYLAYRILSQAGFKAANLDGGFKSVVQSDFGNLATADGQMG